MEQLSETLESTFDHVAVAVPDLDAAMPRWRDDLGGRLVGWAGTERFVSRQLRFGGGGKLELIAPAADAAGDNFLRRFLERHGSQVHHVTLKVDDLDPAVDVLTGLGFEPVEVDRSGEHWKEAFIHPKEAGGIVVQIAWASFDDQQWAGALGHTPEAPPDAAAVLVGPTLTHPDLEQAAWLWRTLGAHVHAETDGLLCEWDDSPVGLIVRSGERAGPTGLMFALTKPRDADPRYGPPVEVLGS